MDRNSLMYKLRRKAQVAAYHVVPHETLSKIYSLIVIHKKVNLKNPKTLNEKLQWYKLRYCPQNELIVQCTDKYQVRDYVQKKKYENILTPLVGHWESVEEIDWDSLPEKFVLKCTHGCAYNILCKDKSSFDVNEAKVKLKKWLKEDFSAFNVEPHYGVIKPRRIICEEYLGDVIVDYKFFCFHGKPRFFYVSSDLIHDREAEMGFFNMDGSKIPLIREDYKDIGNIEMPDCLDEMIKASEILSKDFPFVRVDFFLVDNGFRFAELTFTPASAMMPINPPKYDEEWGQFLDLPAIYGGGINNKINNDFGMIPVYSFAL